MVVAIFDATEQTLADLQNQVSGQRVVGLAQDLTQLLPMLKKHYQLTDLEVTVGPTPKQAYVDAIATKIATRHIF